MKPVGGRWTLARPCFARHDVAMADSTGDSTSVRIPPRRGLSAFAAVVAISAWGGAAGLMVGWLDLGDEVTGRLPFESPVLGGIALIMTVAAPMTVVAILAWRGDPRTGPVTVAAGILQIWWIVVELAFIQVFSFFHPIYVGIGVAFIVLGRRIPRPLASHAEAPASS